MAKRQTKAKLSSTSNVAATNRNRCDGFTSKKKNGKLRPLSIPTMLDRAQQALHMSALQPVAETCADKNSYGFREGRSCADAIGQCFNALAKSYAPVWVLEGDIKSCLTKSPISGCSIIFQWIDESSTNG